MKTKSCWLFSFCLSFLINILLFVLFDSKKKIIFTDISLLFQACNDYVDVSGTAGRKWQRLLQHERDQRLRLEDMVEQLARQHSHLEQEAKEQMNQAMPPGQYRREKEGKERMICL